MQRAVTLMDNALRKDPAAYVINLSNDIKNSFARVAELTFDTNADPDVKAAATADYVTKALAEQRRLGAERPTLLPEVTVDRIVASFYQQPQGGQNAAKMVQALADQWGNAWPEVYGQMASKLPAAAVVIGAGMKEAPAALLAEGAVLTKPEMVKTLPSGDVLDVARYVREELTPFTATANVQNKGALTANQVYEGTELLALQYVRSGMSPNAAAKRAYQDTVGEKYTFRGTFRVPAEYDGAQVERGARVALQNLDTIGVRVPPSAYALSPEDERATYIRSLKAFSKWVTAVDGKGLVLYNALGGAVLGADGESVKQTWDELMAGGAPVPETRNPAASNPYIQQTIREMKGQNLQ
jgi:hypothetical protein